MSCRPVNSDLASSVIIATSNGCTCLPCDKHVVGEVENLWGDFLSLVVFSPSWTKLAPLVEIVTGKGRASFALQPDSLSNKLWMLYSYLSDGNEEAQPNS